MKAGGYVQNTTGSTDDWRVGFVKAITGGVDTDFFSIIPAIGSGMTVNQTSGNLLVTTGTTVNSETILRSTKQFSTDIMMRYGLSLSQRIANQAFYVELVDVIGDALATTINSAVSVTVAIPGHTYTAQNVGQSVYLGGYVGTGTFVPGRYAIASIVAGVSVTFTVAGFAAGTGTASLFGMNYHHVLYDGVTATQTKYDTQRKGYASGDSTVTINTTAAPGHSGYVSYINGLGLYADHLATGGTIAIRADRTANLPDVDTPLYLQIRAVNGSTAPASTTTLTVNYVSVITGESPIFTPAGNLVSSTNAPQQVQVASGTVAIGAGSALIGQVTPSTSGSVYSLTTTASNNLANIKATAGSLYEITLSNPTATACFVKLYNKASAPVVASDVPVLTIPLLAAGNANGLDRVSLEFGAIGKRFPTGIAIAVTGLVADTDATNAVAGAKVHATYI